MSKLFTVTSVGTAVGLQVVLIRELLTTMRCDSRVAVELWRSIKYFWRSKQTRAQSRDFTLTPRSAHFRAHAQSTRLADTAALNYLAARRGRLSRQSTRLLTLWSWARAPWWVFLGQPHMRTRWKRLGAQPVAALVR